MRDRGDLGFAFHTWMEHVQENPNIPPEDFEQRVFGVVEFIYEVGFSDGYDCHRENHGDAEDRDAQGDGYCSDQCRAQAEAQMMNEMTGGAHGHKAETP